ncbi:MliC family protein [Pseudoxanthomonas dokdonensis]|nr:MliC family protein [Pseudoxanthomonas dokdonensis]
MKISFCCLLLLALAACQQPATPVADSGAGKAAAPTAATAVDTAANADSSAAQEGVATSPSFDCGRADGKVEKMICDDAGLATLDRRLAERYGAALARAGANKSMLMSSERGWIKGRDDCWKADDMRQCVLESYQTQLVDLQINHGDITVPTAVEYRCDDNSKPLTAVFYNDLDPKAAVLTWGDDQTIVFPRRAASGARYGRSGVDFWEHQGEVKVDFYGTTLTCTTPA